MILTVRSEDKGRAAVEGIRRVLPRARVRAEIAGLASLQSVRAFAERMEREPHLDLLVNNAGVMALPTREVTEDGFERQFGTSYLGPVRAHRSSAPALASFGITAHRDCLERCREHGAAANQL